MKSIAIIALATLMLSACVPRQPVMPRDQPQLELEPQPQPQPQPQVDRPSMVERSRAAIINPMADVPGEKPLPALQGAVERYDCMTGDEDLHARIAFEARGGQVTYFAYYSKWKPRTCALDFERNAAGTKWRLTADGATRVHTPQGRFLIRTQADAYVFEFEHVRRQRFCRMSGEINGAMTVKRRAGAPECSAVGILDLNGKPRPAH